MKTKAEELRAQWMASGLSRTSLQPDPFLQFEIWYGQAIDSGIAEPNGFSLATVDAQGQPWLRTVLLKIYDRQGFVFFTNYESRKAGQIAGNARVAMLFPWVGLARQVKITGLAERIPMAESMKYFTSRPRGSQIGAWASPQSQVITSRSLLDAKVEEIKRRMHEHEVPLPAFWGGLRVRPGTIEFWQARDSRLHDRFLYTRDEDAPGGWRIERLAP